MDQNDNSITNKTKVSDSLDLASKQGNEVEHAINNSQPNSMGEKPIILP